MSATDRASTHHTGLQERLTHAVAEIIAQGADRAHLLELHYWSKRREDRDLIQTVMGLCKSTRAALHAFLASVPDLRALSASEIRPGKLLLSASSREVNRLRTTKRKYE